MDVTFGLEAIAKTILHATKYPASSVNGLLIRKFASGKGDTENKGIHCEDAIPLTHINMSKFCTPTMEVALAQVEQHCKDSKSEIVGYYQANQDIDNHSPDFIAARIVEKLQEVNPNLIIVLIDNEKLDSNLEEIPFVTYKFSDGKFKVHESRIRLVPDEQGSLSTVSALIQAKAYRQLIDFDNHLDDLRENYWTNPKLTETIQKFAL